MNSKVYKWCAVPQCANSSSKTPDKLFVYVPHKKKVRDKWLKLARRDPDGVALNSPLYFCEDHFDLPNDMENYMQYHLMGSVSQVRMKPECLPKKFECQPDRKRRTTDTVERPYVLKKQRMVALEECEKQLQECSTVPEHLDMTEASGSSVPSEEIPQDNLQLVDKSVQVHITKKFRSKAIQKEIKTENQSTSPVKPHLQSVSTSPFKIKSTNVKHTRPSKRMFRKDQSDSDDNSYTSSYPVSSLSLSKKSLQVLPSKSMQKESTSDCSAMVEDAKQQETLKNQQSTLNKITKNPRSYIGVPKDCYFLVSLIHEQTNIPINHILLCLKKIKLDNSFRELGDDFAMTPTYASKIFAKNVPILASVLHPFIVKLDNLMNKINLPMAFRHKYNNVSCIIDCLEIEVQKPSKALNQALTWSDYKKTNTIKYLVSCTPNGLVNYISPGYGGRITDTCLLETCDFIKHLQPGMCVLADRGFKHVETLLQKEGIQLVRPPSVTTGKKLTKVEAKETKQIASLRIHIERVIRRLREFNMLKPHACVNLNLLKVIDDVITVACGLINLQDSLIK